MERKHYLDNIRWATVVLVLTYHVFYIFNSVGVLGGIGSFAKVQYQDMVLYVIYPWFMVLLFLVAGMSCRYSLQNRTHKELIKSRTVKLLIPSTLGLFVFHWITGYMNIKIGGGLGMIPKFILYPICVVSGIGPLWFIQMLWFFSLLLVLIRKIDKNDCFYHLCAKANTGILLLFFLLIWGAAQILNTPIITVYRFGIYFMGFLLGYFVFSHEEVMDRVQKIRIPMLIVALLMAVAYVWYYFGTNFTEDACLKSLFTNAYLWVVILAILGCFKAWADKTNAFATYMTKASFGIYIVHYVVVLYACYFLKNDTTLPVMLIYVLAIVATLVLSVVLYEVVKRIPVLRYFVLGIKKSESREGRRG